MFPSLFARSCLLFSAVNATVIDVDVGDGDFTFKPDTVMAAVGDELHFHFYPQNHSVIQGDFMNACHPIASGGFFSGFMPVDSDEGVSSHPPRASAALPLPFSTPSHQSSSPQQGHYFAELALTKACKQETMFVVTVTNTEPMFFYCGQVGHCKIRHGWRGQPVNKRHSRPLPKCSQQSVVS